MHQQIHCHTLPKPFSHIFLFRIYAPTTQTYPHHIDPVFAETSVRFPQIPRPYSPRKPIHQRHCPHPQTQIPHPYTPHRFRAHTAPQKHTATQPHKHPQPYAATHATPGPPDVDDVDADALDVVAAPTLTTHREAMPYLDVDAQPASSGLTVRPSGRTRRRSPDAVAGRMQTQPPASPQLDRPGTRQDQARPDRIRPRTRN